MTLIQLLLHDMLFAAIPAVGFAMVFNVPLHILKFCALGGAIGHVLRTFLLQAHFSIEWSSFLAAMTVGFIGIYWARHQRAYPKIFTVAAIIPLVPGVYAFNAVIALVQINSQGYSEALFVVLLNNGLKSMFILGALVIGLTMPSLIFYRRRPLV